MQMLVVEQRDLAGKADVGKAQTTLHDPRSGPGQCTLDRREISAERLLGSRVNLSRNGPGAQRQDVVLRVAREHEAGVQKTVDARRAVGIVTIQRKAVGTEPRDAAHDAVGLEDADASIRTERGRHGAERMRGARKASVLNRRPPKPVFAVRCTSLKASCSSAASGRASKSQSQSASSAGEAPRTSTSTPHRRAAMVAFQMRGFGR